MWLQQHWRAMESTCHMQRHRNDALGASLGTVFAVVLKLTHSARKLLNDSRPSLYCSRVCGSSLTFWHSRSSNLGEGLEVTETRVAGTSARQRH